MQEYTTCVIQVSTQKYKILNRCLTNEKSLNCTLTSRGMQARVIVNTVFRFRAITLSKAEEQRKHGSFTQFYLCVSKHNLKLPASGYVSNGAPQLIPELLTNTFREFSKAANLGPQQAKKNHRSNNKTNYDKVQSTYLEAKDLTPISVLRSSAIPMQIPGPIEVNSEATLSHSNAFREQIYTLHPFWTCKSTMILKKSLSSKNN